MRATYLITIEVHFGDDLVGISDEILRLVEGSFVVHSVKPWKRQELQAKQLDGQQPVSASGGLPIQIPTTTYN